MTKVSERKTRLTFETDAEVRYRGKMRAVIIDVDNSFSGTVRLKGTRQRYEFSWHGLHDWAAEIFVRRQRAEKKKAREEKRKAK